MRTTTILIALTMLTTGLAGCTGDPDGGGNDEFDAETLQGMIESGLADFMNTPRWKSRPTITPMRPRPLQTTLTEVEVFLTLLCMFSLELKLVSRH